MTFDIILFVIRRMLRRADLPHPRDTEYPLSRLYACICAMADECHHIQSFHFHVVVSHLDSIELLSFYSVVSYDQPRWILALLPPVHRYTSHLCLSIHIVSPIRLSIRRYFTFVCHEVHPSISNPRPPGSLILPYIHVRIHDDHGTSS